ncbi:MAG TPA: prolyl oligopeptidase family serine peptidase [Stellaceae bacterium]|nr:prolyl oligopeptidase family serine peptidase [Stellaceae bacterium]
MKKLLIAGSALFAMGLAPSISAAEIVDYFDLPGKDIADLSFPDQPSAFVAAGGTSRMFKPDGAGPFPGLVLLPVCSGHYFMNTFDWAKRALDHGYAVLVVDPLGPRGVRENCTPPQPVGTHRFMKDGFDAAEHLRKQPFVDRDHVGLMGFSLGAMAGLGASGPKHAHEGGRKPFQAIVAAYPICKFPSIKLSTTGQVAELHFLPDRIEVPLLVLMGDRDNETHAVRDCVPMLDPLKSSGNPVDYRLYHATHNWDARETRAKPFSKRGFDGETIVYEYDEAVTEQSAKDAFAFLDAHLKKNRFCRIDLPSIRDRRARRLSIPRKAIVLCLFSC